MMCRFSQLRRKEVINICDGSRLGCVGDLELCIPEGSVQRFGEDIILIDKPFQRREGEKKKRRW